MQNNNNNFIGSEGTFLCIFERKYSLSFTIQMPAIQPLFSPAEPRPVYLTTIWLLSFHFDFKLPRYYFHLIARCRTFVLTSYVLT